MNKLLPLSLLLALSACGTPEPDVDELAQEYLFLELSMGLHDAAHVDAYFGPEAYNAAAETEAMSLDDIRLASGDLARRLAAVSAGDNVMLAMRIDGLIARLHALDTRIAINKQEYLDFDAEALALFGSKAPDYDAAHFQAILDKVNALLPGEGPLAARVEAFNNNFVIPRDRMDAVFTAAMDECRRRTLEHIDLPENESFTIEYVNDKPWTGYNWYQGNAQSLIQLNTDFPMYISKAVDLGCHEGYPGHHTFNALLEKNLVEDQGWIEYSLYPLFSPQSLIAEGSGNYGINLAFPGDERAAFEKEILFPLAGLDTEQADLYYEVAGLIAQLDFADNEAARDYLNGDITRDEAAVWVQTYELERKDKSVQRTRFFDAYRSYVINYNHGKALVIDYVERDGADADERWARFEKMLSSPMLPADLQK
jgi:hypothetical protein